MNSATLSDFVEERIQKLSIESKVSTEKLLTEYKKIFADPFIQNDPQFATDSQRYRYAIQVLIARTRAVKPNIDDLEEAEIR